MENKLIELVEGLFPYCKGNEGFVVLETWIDNGQLMGDSIILLTSEAERPRLLKEFIDDFDDKEWPKTTCIFVTLLQIKYVQGDSYEYPDGYEKVSEVTLDIRPLNIPTIVLDI